jgi:hypothetical protein
MLWVDVGIIVAALAVILVTVPRTSANQRSVSERWV